MMWEQTKVTSTPVTFFSLSPNEIILQIAMTNMWVINVKLITS